MGGDSGLAEIRDRALGELGPVERRGDVRDDDVWPGFVEKVLSFVDPSALRPLRIVVDAANGMAGVMLPPVLDRLPQLEVVRCYFDPDGTFPNHEPNPLLPANREFIIRKTREEQAQLGVAFDGDGDRCFFVDDTGEFVPGDFITALLAQSVLQKEPGSNGDLRRPRKLGGASRDRGSRRDGARQPGRTRVHQASNAQGGRGLRRRGLRALLLPRLLTCRLRSRAVPADAGAPLAPTRSSRRSSLPSGSTTSSQARSTPRSQTSRSSSRSSRSATPARADASRTSTACPSSSTTGTST